MTTKSTAFEQRIERIHRLLEAEDAVVIWNERILDPDNPTQTRQIDVTIRRNDSLALVECRIHKEPQDVTWIEELIGRRQSLGADAVIAVSSSGFSEGAERKAEAYGIILRDFNSLTKEEISNWGKQRKVELVFYEFTNAVITFAIPDPPAPPIRITDDKGRPVIGRSLFEQVMNKIEDEERKLAYPGAIGHFEAEFDAPIHINGVRATRTKFQADIRRVSRQVPLCSLVAYADPLADNHRIQALVGSLELGISEIVEVSDRIILVVDLSQIPIPPNHLFHSILYDFGRIVEVRETKFIGLPDAMKFQNSVSFRFENS